MRKGWGLKIKQSDWELSPASVELYEQEYGGNVIFDISYTMFILQQLERSDLTEVQHMEAWETRLSANFFTTILQILSVTYTGKKFKSILKYIGADSEKGLAVLMVAVTQFFQKHPTNKRDTEKILKSSAMARVSKNHSHRMVFPK